MKRNPELAKALRLNVETKFRSEKARFEKDRLEKARLKFLMKQPYADLAQFEFRDSGVFYKNQKFVGETGVAMSRSPELAKALGLDVEAKVTKEETHLKENFFKKYPYADFDRFDFQVLRNPDGSRVKEINYKVDDKLRVDITSDTFKKNKQYQAALTKNQWPKIWDTNPDEYKFSQAKY